MAVVAASVSYLYSLFPGQFVVKLLDQTPLVVDLQSLVLGVEGCFDILELESLADFELLFQDVDVPFSRDQANEGDLAHTDRELLAIQ